MNGLDPTDLRLLDALQRDAQLPRKQLAELCHISEATCSRRLASLEQRGLIVQYRAVLNAAKLGFGLTVFVLVQMENEHSAALKKFEARLKKSPLVHHVSFISGEYDYLLHLVARDMAEYHDFTESHLVDEACVKRYMSLFEMKKLYESHALPLRKGGKDE